MSPLQLTQLVVGLLLASLGVCVVAQTGCNPQLQCCSAVGAGTPACGNAVGNPLNTLNGNKFQVEVDMPALPGVLGLELVRNYNSVLSGSTGQRGMFGRGWRSSYEVRLTTRGDSKAELTLPDGAVRSYALVATPLQPGGARLFRLPQAEHGEIRLSPSQSVWHQADGTGWLFDERGRLASIQAPSGEVLRLERDPQGNLAKVTDPQGRQLEFHYAGAHSPAPGNYRMVNAVTTPLGRFEYRYGQGPQLRESLVLVRAPSQERLSDQTAVERNYHYEDTRWPTLLTGISSRLQGSDAQAAWVREVTWGYDPQGRANLSVKGEPAKRSGSSSEVLPGTGVEQVTLDFTARRADGSGATVLTNSLGQKTRYDYKLIRGVPELVQVIGAGCASCGPINVRYRFNQAGQRTHRIVLDAQGREMEQFITEYDAHWRVRRQGKPGRWQSRYEYRAPFSVQASLIGRPSVRGGKEHQFRLAYNRFGQVTEVTETGYSPLDQIELSRSMRFDYRLVNGRSLLHRLDGPLPIGEQATSKEAESVRYQYDPTGSFVTHLYLPGGLSSSFAHDAAGRVQRIENEEGLVTTVQYNVTGKRTLVTSQGPGWEAPLSRHLSYDARGNLTEFTARQANPQERGGVVTGWKRVFDAHGRLAFQGSTSGSLSYLRYDSESNLVYAGEDADGVSRSARLGVAAVRVGALKRQLDVLEQMDDFGRVVTTTLPDSGRTLYQYDQADRLVAMQDANGHRALYRYDAAGRIESQEMLEAGTQASSLTRWKYRGRRVSEVIHPTQSERYTYDQRGLRISKEVILSASVRSQTRYEYDSAGRVVSVSLADGSLLVYQRDRLGQIVSVLRRPQRSGWLSWPGKQAVLASSIERDAIGLRSYIAGNGIQAHYGRDAQGTLARLAYHSGSPRPQAKGLPSQIPGSPGALGFPVDRSAVSDRRFLWDAGGNLLLNDASSVEGSLRSSYAYDARNRLIAGVQAWQAGTDSSHDYSEQAVWRFAYDQEDRRVLAQETGEQADVSSGTLRPAFRSGRHLESSASHSAAGQLTGRPGSATSPVAGWDTYGRLRHLEFPDGRVARYQYDHRGLRNAKTVSVSSANTSQEEHTAGFFLYDDNRQLSAELDAAGKITRIYIYLADVPLAVVDKPAQAGVLKRIRALLFGAAEEVAYLHSNHLRAPEVATDEQGEVIWRARYAPFGAATLLNSGVHPGSVRASKFILNLRLAGQYEDQESGLHYNRQRYYDPRTGQYLSPDPLGRPDGPNPYAYVAHNPLRYVDPDGLVLFAFDGTGNSDQLDDPAMQANGLSNVVKFRDLYLAGPARYVSGVGTLHTDSTYGNIVPASYASGKALDWLSGSDPLYLSDMGGNYSGPARVSRMVQYMQDEADVLDDQQVMQIDIIGFSRGAAQARLFANLLVDSTANGYYRYPSRVGLTGLVHTGCQRVNYRFMGLWDSVLATNFSGTAYNLAIPGAFSHVAHAVALNEYRSSQIAQWSQRNPLSFSQQFGGFPLDSIGASSDRVGAVRVERGFLGAHADIGGGYPAAEGQLAQIALQWMVRQARDAGVVMRPNREFAEATVGSAVLHDQSNAILLNQPGVAERLGQRPPYSIVSAEDREVRNSVAGTQQRNMRFNNNSMTNTETHQFIRYAARDLNRLGDASMLDPQTLGNKTGTVDVPAYLSWLRNHGYTF